MMDAYSMYESMNKPIEHDGCCNCKYDNRCENEAPCIYCKGTVPHSSIEYKTRPDLYEPIETELPIDMVNHPPHYTNGGMEAIDEMLIVFGRKAVMDFCICNVWKYRKRALHKNKQEDLDKADWYMSKYKELEDKDNGIEWSKLP